MQTPTGRQRPTQPIPRPRPSGPADLGILADDLDYLAEMNARGLPPVPRRGLPGPRTGLPESETARDGLTQVGGLELYADSAVGPHADDDFDDRYGPGPDEDLSDPEPAGPIFVDSSGRRRKLARRASIAAVAVVAGYAGLLAVSFAGGPIPPKALLPVPGIPAEKAPAPASSPAADNGAKASGDAGATDHSTNGARPAGGTSEHRTVPRTSATTAASGQSTPSVPKPTSALSTTPAPTSAPSPTGVTTTASTTHGNQTPPGHTHTKP